MQFVGIMNERKFHISILIILKYYSADILYICVLYIFISSNFPHLRFNSKTIDD